MVFLSQALASIRSGLSRTLSLRGEDGRGVRLGVWLLVAVGVEIAALAIAPRVPLSPWFGPALLLAVLLPAFAELAKTPPARWKSALEYTLVLGLFAALAWAVWGSAVRDRVPIDTGDHQIMIARAEVQIRALEAGRWLRWTNLVQGGESLTDLYPIFTNLLLFVFYELVPDGTPFLETYTLFMVFVWWLRAVATYTLARRFAKIPIALVIGLAAGFDVGRDVWDGVWYGTVYWGMLHNNVALSCAQLAGAFQVDLLRRTSSRRFVVCALLVATTAFAHPLGIMVSGVSMAAYVVAWFTEREMRRETFWVVVASALGLLLAAGWILPFAYGQEHFGFSNAVGGIMLQELADGLLSGASPTSSFGAWIGFVALAVVGSLLTRDPALVATGLSAMVFVFLPVLEVMTESGGFTLLPGLLAGQQRRMLTVAKCLSVPAVAWLFERTLGRALLPTTLSVRPVLTRAALLVLLGAGVVRLGYLAFQPLKKSLRDQAKSGPMARERSHTGEDYKKVFDAVTTARRRDKSPTPFRVAINWVAELRHAAWGEGFSNRVPVVDYINASANFLNIRPRELSERGFHDWNIRYLITTSGEPPFPKLTKVLQTGRYTLWELDTYDDRFVVAPAGVQIQKLKVGEGRIEFSVAGAPASGVDVTVRSAWYPRWRVRGAGSDLRATPPHPGAKPNQDQILVHVRNGRVKLDCDGMFPRELTGYSLSSLGLFGLVLLARGRRREAALEHVARYAGRLRDLARRQLARLPSRRWIRFVPWGIGLVALGATFALIGRKNLLLPPPHAPGLVVRANAASGRSLGCHREHALGAYVCDEGVQIKSALGSTPVGDDTGEFAELWPAVRVDYGTGKPVIELEFSRVDLKSGTVNLRYEAHGKVHVELAVGDYTSKSRMWWGYGKIGIDVPKSLRPRTLIVRLEPEGPGAVLFQQMP